MAKKSALREQIKIEKSGSNTNKSKLSAKIEHEGTKKGYVMDLRIHSPSSLGYMALEGIDTAPALVRLAKVKGLDVIAVTDYFTGCYIDRVREAAKTTPVTVIPGVVIRCVMAGCNDVLLLCLFPDSFRSKEVEEFLRDLGVPESAAGNANYLLERPFEEVLSKIDAVGAVAIPTTMDKTPYRKSAIPDLVEKYGFRVFDLSYYSDSVLYFKKMWPHIKFHLLSFSSANALAQVGNRNSKVKMSAPDFLGLKSVAARE